MKSVLSYLKYLVREFLDLTTYFYAIVIGTVIDLLIIKGFPGKLVPFIIPFIVQIFAKASVKFKYRNKDMLLQLPSNRNDPVFIMDSAGNILYSAGWTFDIFCKHSVRKISDFISKEHASDILDQFSDCERHQFSDVYSDCNYPYRIFSTKHRIKQSRCSIVYYNPRSSRIFSYAF